MHCVAEFKEGNRKLIEDRWDAINYATTWNSMNDEERYIDTEIFQKEDIAEKSKKTNITMH